MARTKTNEAFKRDNILVDFLFTHKGAENIASAQDIAQHLTAQGYPSTTDSVGDLVRRLILERRLPICSYNRKGYFWASTRTELANAINDLQSRSDALLERISILNAFLID